MKKFFIVIFFVLILALFLPLITGTSYGDIFDMGKDLYKSFNKPEYFDDIELEVMQGRNSSEIGAIKAKDALELVKNNYAQSFGKIYFNEDEAEYIYKMPENKIYLAVSDIVILEERDFYQVELFEVCDESDKKVLSYYYVDSKTQEIYDEEHKPSETKVYKDHALGFMFKLPTTYDNYIMMSYLEDTFAQINGEQINIIPVQFNYVEDGISNLLFTLFIFDGIYSKEDFSATMSSAYYLGANNNYTFVLVKSSVNDNYFAKAKEFLNVDFDYVVKNAKIY